MKLTLSGKSSLSLILTSVHVLFCCNTFTADWSSLFDHSSMTQKVVQVLFFHSCSEKVVHVLLWSLWSTCFPPPLSPVPFSLPPSPPALPSLFFLEVLGSCLLSRLTDSADSRTFSLEGPCFLSLFSFCILPSSFWCLSVPQFPAMFNGSKFPLLYTSFFLSDLTSAFPQDSESPSHP